MSQLFSPARIGPLDLENRIVVAPMCQYSAADGCATDWHLMHLGQLAMSGAALLITEATAVLPEGRISPVDLGLYDDANEAALGRVLGAVRRYSTMPIGVQLAHAGRKASVRPPWQGAPNSRRTQAVGRPSRRRRSPRSRGMVCPVCSTRRPSPESSLPSPTQPGARYASVSI